MFISIYVHSKGRKPLYTGRSKAIHLSPADLGLSIYDNKWIPNRKTNDHYLPPYRRCMKNDIKCFNWKIT